MKITYTINSPKSGCSGEYIWRRSYSKKKQERGGTCLDQTYFTGLRSAVNPFNYLQRNAV